MSWVVLTYFLSWPVDVAKANPTTITAAAATTTSDQDLTVKVSSMAMQMIHRNKVVTPMKYTHRHLQTNQCFLDTLSMYEKNPTLDEAYSAFDPEYEAAVEACSGFICVIDENTFTASVPFIQACQTAGGIIYEYNLDLGCIVGNGEEVSSVKVSYLNVHHCLAPQSCDSQAVVKQSEQEADADLKQFEDALLSSYNLEDDDENTVSASCHVNYSVKDTSGNTLIADRIEGASRPNDSISENSISDTSGIRSNITFDIIRIATIMAAVFMFS